MYLLVYARVRVLVCVCHACVMRETRAHILTFFYTGMTVDTGDIKGPLQHTYSLLGMCVLCVWCVRALLIYLFKLIHIHVQVRVQVRAHGGHTGERYVCIVCLCLCCAVLCLMCMCVYAHVATCAFVIARARIRTFLCIYNISHAG